VDCDLGFLGVVVRDKYSALPCLRRYYVNRQQVFWMRSTMIEKLTLSMTEDRSVDYLTTIDDGRREDNRITQFSRQEDRIVTYLCMDDYKRLRILQQMFRCREAKREVDLLRAKPTELFHPVYGQRRQELLQKRDAIKKTW
jgi:hypothetical protein